MKNTNLILIAIFGLAFTAIFGFSCNTTKNKVDVNHDLLITLVDNVSGKYLSNTYKDYNPQEIKKANRTLNQYRAIFSCSDKKFATLKTELQNDATVTAVADATKKTDKPQNGKNDNHSKTKPIRDKN